MKIADTALQTIEAAVKAAEAKTRGEIVVAAVDVSGDYGAPRAAFALGAALLATVASLALAAPAWAVGFSWPLAVALGWALTMIPAVKRAVVPAAELDAEVLESAKAAFFDHGVHRTADRAGVLVYLSLQERRVLVLADAGVHAVVGEEGWKAHVSKIVEAMRSHHPEAMAAVVAAIGEVLAAHFPPAGENKNELPDEVRRA